jgi:phytanoyl-CoA hydroxylase
MQLQPMKDLVEQSALYIVNKTVTSENVAFYEENGYLIAPDLLDASEILKLREETLKIFRGERGLVEGLQDSKQDVTPTDTLKKYLAIHFPHKISPVIKDFMAHNRICHVLENIISPNVKGIQSMLFVKAPGKPGQAWHQDEYYIPTRDRSLTGAWIAIDDADITNGCLWVIPGSHKSGYIMKRVPYHGNEYGDVDTIDPTAYDNVDPTPVEVKSGAVVFFNGYLLHSSLRNKTKDRFRTALVNHYMSAESMLPWDLDGTISLKEDMRDILMVAGKDPYAYKGIEQITAPFLRPDKIDYKSSPDIKLNKA